MATSSDRQYLDDFHRERRNDYVYEHNTTNLEAIEQKNVDVMDMTLADPSFAGFARDAYNSPNGYSIRLNPRTGEKEMFVTGSNSKYPLTTAYNWGANVVEGIGATIDRSIQATADYEYGLMTEWLDENGLGKGLMSSQTEGPYRRSEHLLHWRFGSDYINPFRRDYAQALGNRANEAGVEIVYGYSRGASYIAYMPTRAKKVALDGAMITLRPVNDIDMNIRTNDVADQFLSAEWLDTRLGQSDRTKGYVSKNTGNFHKVWNP